MPAAKPPHVPALDPKYETPPAKEIGRGFRPLDGVAYKVEDGDNWETLAIFCGWNAWDLIDYNFHTREPRHVNWYLRNYTGCKLTTWDNKNYSMSDSAEPGIIYFPSWAYRNFIASGRKPKPVYWEDDAYTVHGTVPAIAQWLTYACWAGAITIMHRWKYPAGPRSIADNLEEIGSKWALRYKHNKGLDNNETDEVAEACGLTPAKVPHTPTAWARMLKDRGPLMTIQNVTAEWTHWIVVYGFVVEMPVTFDLRWVDPGNGSRNLTDGLEIGKSALAVPGAWTRVYHW